MTKEQRQRMELLLARFVEHMQVSGWSERTIPDYERNVRFLFDWLAAETTVTDLSQVTREWLSKYQTSLYYQAAHRERPLAMATQFTRLSVLRTFFRYLVKHDYLVHDPAAALELPKRRPMLPRNVLTHREVERLLHQPNVKTPLGLRDRAILEVLYSTGMRNAELRALTRYDVDTAAGTVRIVRGKNAKDRVIPLGQVAANFVQEYLTEARPKLVRDDTTILFLSKKGRRLTGDNLLVRIEKYARAAKIAKPVGAHAFRHTCATHMLRGGADIRHIQMLLGHASVATTQIYTQVEISDLKAIHRQCHPRERTPKKSCDP